MYANPRTLVRGGSSTIHGDMQSRPDGLLLHLTAVSNSARCYRFPWLPWTYSYHRLCDKLYCWPLFASRVGHAAPQVVWRTALLSMHLGLCQFMAIDMQHVMSHTHACIRNEILLQYFLQDLINWAHQVCGCTRIQTSNRPVEIYARLPRLTIQVRTFTVCGDHWLGPASRPVEVPARLVPDQSLHQL